MIGHTNLIHSYLCYSHEEVDEASRGLSNVAELTRLHSINLRHELATFTAILWVNVKFVLSIAMYGNCGPHGKLSNT